LVPGLLAFLFGYFAFRSKIKGVYFSIMTQALTYAGMLLFFRNETGFGGNNGFTGFTTLLGFPITAAGTRVALFLATVLLLAASLAIGFALARSKFGRVLTAVRDAENRLTFCGYDPKGFKLFVWTLSAVLCRLPSGWRSAGVAPWWGRCSAPASSTAPRAGSPWPFLNTGSFFSA
jgi:urea transport system permease protein